MIAGFRRIREAQNQQGYATSTPGPAKFLVLTGDRVLIDRSIRHYRADGTLLAERANLYILTRSTGRWRISGTIQQDPKFVGKLE